MNASTGTRIAVACLAAVVLSCARDSAVTTSDHVVRDSAGIRVVESRRPLWNDSTRWRVAVTPKLRLGGPGGEQDVPAEANFVDIVDGLRLRDGRIVIADRGAAAVRVFDDRGSFESEIGRRGEGPGEFRGVTRVFRLTGDSVAVFDWGANQLMVFAPDGRFLRSTQLERVRSGFPTLVVGVFGDGNLLVEESVQAMAEGPLRIERHHLTLYRYGPEGSLQSVLGTFEGLEQVVGPTGVRRPTGQEVIGRLPRLFARFTAYAAAGQWLIIGDNTTYELKWLDSTGTTRQIARRPHNVVSVSSDDVDIAMRAQLDRIQNPELRRRRERAFEMQPSPPDSFPAFGGTLPNETLVLDGCDNLWVAEYIKPHDVTGGWSVFDGAGRWLGTIALPKNGYPLHIGADILIVRITDEMDVHYIEVYELKKPHATAACLM